MKSVDYDIIKSFEGSTVKLEIRRKYALKGLLQIVGETKVKFIAFPDNKYTTNRSFCFDIIDITKINDLQEGGHNNG